MSKSTDALLRRKPEEALYWARLFIDEFKSREGDPCNFVDHTLVRAELASGNGSSAKRLLAHFQEKGTVVFMDDFYFARAELLLGNRSAATAHFAKLKKSLERFDEKKRLDFEFR